MNDRSSLLDQLRIDRDEPAPRRGRAAWWAAAAVLAAALLAGAAAIYYLRPAPLPIAVAVAEPAPAETGTSRGATLDASGYVVARRQATVSSKITGKVVELLIEEGQRVEADQIIARLDDSNDRAAVAQAEAQLAQARANLTAAEVAFANAQPVYDRHRAQFERDVISAQDFDLARAQYDASRTSLTVAERAVEVAEANLAVAERRLDDTIVRAPFAGVVTVKAAQEGEMVSPVSAGGGFTRTGIGTIVDMDSLEIEVDVSENFINRVHAGQDVVARLNAYPSQPIPARVVAIIPTADRAKATVRVRIGFEERDERVLPQMGVRVAFLGGAEQTPARSAAEPAVLLPEAAVSRTGDSGVVFVLRDGLLERRTVRVGEPTGTGRVAVSGLAAGARVAVGDLAQLSDGLRVRVVEQ